MPEPKVSEPVFVIWHAGLRVDLAVGDVGSLRLHERILPDYLAELGERVARDGFIKHPIVADRESLTVLDGTHRTVLLRKLGIRWAPLCLVDYRHPSVTVGCWFRALRGLTRSKAVSALEDLGVGCADVEPGRGDELVDSGRACFAIVARDFALSVEGDLDLVGKYDLIWRLEDALRRAGVTIDYRDPEEAKSMLEEGSIDAIIVTPKIDKESVVRSALIGRALPPKTTRHLVPARFLDLFVPLGMLRMGQLEEVTSELARLVRKKRPVLLPPGSVVGRRRYLEEVYVFEDVEPK